MNLGDRYLQYRTWAAAHPRANRGIQIGAIVFAVWLLGYLSGRFA